MEQCDKMKNLDISVVPEEEFIIEEEEEINSPQGKKRSRKAKS